MQDIGALVFHCPEDGCSKSYSRKKNVQRHIIRRLRMGQNVAMLLEGSSAT